ncbi:hypothetical protein POTOM_038084 [Populus tomentosa]|uniref:Pentatricopeptide repeat-containing protein n=1 Tax=Populus tomentosa TaxID=118781 RepID=A0A8X8CKR2_POPTO|nr:hypothetical protein POTOM_038084 [Populus tomentosa]
MKGLNVLPNCVNFPLVLKSCVKINALKEGGEELLCFVIKSGFRANPFVAASLIDMQASGEATEAAYRVFGYIEAGDIGRAQELFNKMPNKDVMSWKTVLNGYARYARNGCFSEVLSAFKWMLVDENAAPNDATLVNVLESWLQGKCYVGNALMDMYAKCGVVETAFDVFKSMDKKDLISWNTVIGGLAVHGHPEKERIYGTLRALTKSKRSSGYRPDFMGLDERNSKAIKRPMELIHAREIMYFGTVRSIFVAEMLMLKIFVQRRSSSLR